MRTQHTKLQAPCRPQRGTAEVSLIRGVLLAVTLLSSAWLGGCCQPDGTPGRQAHLVVGLGFFSVDDDLGRHQVGDGIEARAQRLSATGVFVSFVPGMSGLLAGSTERQVIEIDPNAEILAECETDPNDLMKVSAWRPRRPPTNKGKRERPLFKE